MYLFHILDLGFIESYLLKENEKKNVSLFLYVGLVFTCLQNYILQLYFTIVKRAVYLLLVLSPSASSSVPISP